jgi:thioredoxin 1
MFTRRTFTFMMAAMALPVFSAKAAEQQGFTPEALKQAQEAGKPILIDISATWCPTCKAQAPIIDSLMSRKKFEDFVMLKVDFDEQRDVVRELGARSQSTLIVFRGANEIDRSVGSTDPAEIEALLSKAL